MFVSSIRKGNPLLTISMLESLLPVCNDPIHGSNKLRWITSFGQRLKHLVLKLTSQGCPNIDNLTTMCQFPLILCNLSSLKEVSCQFHCIYACPVLHLVRNCILHHSLTASTKILSTLCIIQSPHLLTHHFQSRRHTCNRMHWKQAKIAILLSWIRYHLVRFAPRIHWKLCRRIDSW